MPRSLTYSLASVRELTIGTVDDRLLTVYDAGDPDGRPIVFHHGTPASGKPFDPHITLAHERGIRLVSYDRAGYGASTRHAGREVVDVVQDVESIAEGIHGVVSNSSLREDLRRRGLERASENTWDRTAQQTLQLLLDQAKS